MHHTVVSAANSWHTPQATCNICLLMNLTSPGYLYLLLKYSYTYRTMLSVTHAFVAWHICKISLNLSGISTISTLKPRLVIFRNFSLSILLGTYNGSNYYLTCMHYICIRIATAARIMTSSWKSTCLEYRCWLTRPIPPSLLGLSLTARRKLGSCWKRCRYKPESVAKSLQASTYLYNACT